MIGYRLLITKNDTFINNINQYLYNQYNLYNTYINQINIDDLLKTIKQ